MVERSQPSLWVAARRSSFPNLDRREKRRGRILRNGKKQEIRKDSGGSETCRNGREQEHEWAQRSGKIRVAGRLAGMEGSKNRNGLRFEKEEKRTNQVKYLGYYSDG